MIINKQIKNGNIKLCGSNGLSWPIAAIVFCRMRIRLRNPSIIFLSIYSTLCSFIKIQDINLDDAIKEFTIINGNFEHFNNIF